MGASLSKLFKCENSTLLVPFLQIYQKNAHGFRIVGQNTANILKLNKLLSYIAYGVSHMAIQISDLIAKIPDCKITSIVDGRVAFRKIFQIF